MEQSDIVVKLHEEGLGWGIGPALLCQQAAAEITRLRVAMAEAVPASQIRAEVLREAAALVEDGTFRTNENGDFCSHDVEQHEYCDECLPKQILALIDAPKVTT